VYTDAGTATCAGRPGSYGYESIDAQTYAAWNVSYIKCDNCNNNNVDPHIRYGNLAKALNVTGHPMEFRCGPAQREARGDSACMAIEYMRVPRWRDHRPNGASPSRGLLQRLHLGLLQPLDVDGADCELRSHG
jgi:hypothetical protein